MSYTYPENLFDDWENIDAQVRSRFPELDSYSGHDRMLLYSWALDKRPEMLGEPITIGAVVAIIGVIGTQVGAGIQIAKMVQEARTSKQIDEYARTAAAIREETAQIKGQSAAVAAVLTEEDRKAKTNTLITAGIVASAIVAGFFI